MRVKFKPNAAQLILLNDPHNRKIIPKARQLGMTTFIQLYMLDTCLFRPNTNAGVIAHTQHDVQKFFKDKIKYAYDNLADHLKQLKKATSDSANELSFENGSVISVGTSLRGGTNRLLHLSEYGKVCAKFPDKAKEIKTGAFPTVPKDGEIWIESTTEGRGGDFHKKCMDAKHLQESGEPLTQLDYKLIFLPWYTDPEYTIDQNVVINTAMQEYFADLERKGVELTIEQKNWYVITLREQDEDMMQEYPSTLEEAFMGSQKGAIFGKQMKMLRNNKRIIKVPVMPALPIHTAWDIGRDTTSIWFFQKVGLHYHFVDYYENEGEDIEFYVNILKGRNYLGSPYRYGTAYLPHDGERRYVTQKLSACDILDSYGFDTQAVPRTKDKWLSIGRARKALPLCYFDDEKCDEGLIHLENYSKEWDEKHAIFKKIPLHNAASHCSDAYMSFADGFFLYDEVEDEEYERYNDERMGCNATTGY